MRLCTTEGCTRQHYAKGFCNYHYKASRKPYVPKGVVPLITPEEVERRQQHALAMYRQRMLSYKGFTPEVITGLRALQNDKCAICDRDLVFDDVRKGNFRDKAQADHCHKTNAARGFLCIRCNATLGNVEGLGLDKLERLLAYMRDPPASRLPEE